MSEQIRKHPLNVTGKYYVDFNRCAHHEYCVYNAPNNFMIDPAEHFGAYVFKQPINSEEEAQCCRAMEQCPSGAIRDDGDI